MSFMLQDTSIITDRLLTKEKEILYNYMDAEHSLYMDKIKDIYFFIEICKIKSTT